MKRKNSPFSDSANRTNRGYSQNDRLRTGSSNGANTNKRRKGTVDNLSKKNSLKRPVLEPRTATDVERLMRIERRKARNRAIGMSILVVFIMLLTTVMIILVMNRTKPRPRFMFIQHGTVEHTVQSTGLIIRDETVFNAPASGIVKPLATEGSRISRGQKVALIIPANQEDKIKELQKYEQDIVDLQIELMNSGKGAGARAIYDETNAAMSSVINLIRSDITRDDLSGISNYSTSLSVLIDQRSTKLLSVDFRDSRIDQLKNSKAQLELSLGLDSGTLICQTPGILSFQLDGLEAELNTTSAMTVTPQQFDDYLNKKADSQRLSEIVETEDPVLRITGSLNQVLLFKLENTSADNFEVGEYYDLSIPSDGISIPSCRIIRSDQTGDDLMLAFETDRRIEWFSDRRSIETELILSSTEGMKVPMVSLIDFNQSAKTAEIMIVFDGFTRICPVKIIDHDRDYAIIEAIESAQYKPEISTILVVNPLSIGEGELIAD